MLIFIKRSDYNGSPIYLNGKEIRLYSGMPFDVASEIIEIIDRAGIPYRVADGAPTGRYIIPSTESPRVSVAINGRLTYYPADVPLTLDATTIAILLAGGITLIEELASGGPPGAFDSELGLYIMNDDGGYVILGD